ncbi:hypothetical protein KBA63_01590 [Candidatus Woesebacteria bacterium]|jgi:hypothetical protein|nr:hypothetical protein [Candidatus Woesebacteria bacterium]MBP9687145.1 hypothetical protein [Candidatus Woesebacteria bacterium]
MKHHKHIRHYIPLFAVFAVGIIGFLSFPYDRALQIAIATGLAVSYAIWGIVHHAIDRDLSLEVILEYIFVSAIGLSGMLTVLYWS